MEERLAAGEVELLDLERQRLVRAGAHLGAGHQRDAIVRRAGGDEAVRAGEIAERPRHLDPERIQMEERLLR